MSLTGLQVLAIAGLQQGEGIAIPDISSEVSTYEDFQSVSEFITVYNAAPSAAITPENVILLQNIGANSCPFLFGATPYEYSDNIGIGPIITKSNVHLNILFGNVSSSSIFAQVVNAAQTYAVKCADTLNSANGATWNGNLTTAISGGLSSIANNFQIVGNAFSQLGNLINFKSINAGFSAAAIFLDILNNGDQTVGNLHLNFFGKAIVDANGNTYIVNAKTLQMILNNPVAPDSSTSFAIAALNYLEGQLRILADQALTATPDLDAVITYIGVSGTAAAAINQFSDCLNPELMFQSASGNLLVDPLTTWNLLYSLSQNITGLANLTDCPSLANLLLNIQPLGNLNILASMTSPVNAQVIANLQNQLGPGTGANGNPTVADIMGSTNIAGALTDSITILNGYAGNLIYDHISSDLSNVATVVVDGWPGSAHLSNGNSYTDANLFCGDAANLVNLNANTLVGNTTVSSYEYLAESLNSSMLLLSKAGINIASYSNSVNSLVDFGTSFVTLASQSDEVTGLINVIDPVIDDTVTGQALQASLIESQNNQQLNSVGIVAVSQQ